LYITLSELKLNNFKCHHGHNNGMKLSKINVWPYSRNHLSSGCQATEQLPKGNYPLFSETCFTCAIQKPNNTSQNSIFKYFLV